MKLLRLGDVCTKIGSGATPRGGSDVYLAKGIALIRSQNVHNDGFHRDGLAYISDAHATDLAGVEVQAGDVLLNITGDSVARCCQAPADVLPARVNQHVAIIRPQPQLLDPRFLYYHLISPSKQAEMLSIAGGGGTRNALTKGMVEGFEIPAPEIDDQRAITDVLGTLDDKIEQNRRISATLQRLARAVFRAWFVDFEPVKAKAAGATAFPSMAQSTFDALPTRLIDSELGPVPEGWDVKPFRDILDLEYGKGLKADNRRNGNIAVYGSNGPVGWHDTALVNEAGIVVGRKGNPGTVRWVPTPFFPIDTTFFVSVKSDAPPLSVLYHLLESADLPRLTADSAVPGLNRNMVYAELTIVPPTGIGSAFDDVVSSVRALQHALGLESRKLAELRDYLLPKLLSGKVRVGVTNA